MSHQEARSDGVLLTGATGFVGMELLARYLERTDRDVYVLVRGPNDRAAATRVERTLACLFGFGHPYGRRADRAARAQPAWLRSATAASAVATWKLKLSWRYRRTTCSS